MLDMLIGKVKGIFNTLTIIELVFSIICIIIGLVFFINPNLSNGIVSILAGILFLLYGASSIFCYIKRGTIDIYNNNLIYGIVLVVVSILMFFLKNVLSIILGIYLIVVGIERINYGLVLKKFNESSWIITTVIGAMLITIAIITIFANDNTIIKVTGLYLMSFGLFNFINMLLLRRRSEFFLD